MKMSLKKLKYILKIKNLKKKFFCYFLDDWLK